MNQLRQKQEEPLLALNHISFRYPAKKDEITALRSLSFTVETGEFLCVLGPSGCGKSTLLRMIAGFLKPTQGEIRMDGRRIQGPDWHRGVIFQAPTLYSWLNVRENIAFGLKMRKTAKDEIRNVTQSYIERVGLKGFETKKPYELSGGMKQRVSLARALVNQPDLLLMDEPLGALDALTRQDMQALVRKIWHETGNTVLLVTHDVDEALALGTRIMVLSSRPGRILNEFYPDFTRRFLSGDGEEVQYLPEYLAMRREIMKEMIRESGPAE
ncbi:MAG: ABC transporter ATP-binding protein [Oscillospiraceae bacterium]|nr:ABC transporter ATP-binding protein [Oscillospiraceae bacterium]